MDSPHLRKVLAVVGALGLALVVYGLFFWSNDEDLILERLDELTAAIAVTEGNTNPAIKAMQLKGAFQEIFTESVQVDIPELNRGSQIDRGELAKGGASLAGRFKSVGVGLSSVDVQISGDTATVQARAELNGADYSGRPRRDVRDVTFGFVEQDGEWRISSVEVGESTGDLF